MADLLSHRSALAAAFRASLPQPVQVFEHGGRFDLQQLQTYTKQAPCVGIAVLGGDQVDERTQPAVRLNCAAYIATKPSIGQLADQNGLRLASVVLSLLHGQGYSNGPAQDDSAQRPTNIAFTNLYSGQVNADGVWLAAITWRQIVSLNVPANAEGLADFITFSAAWHLPPSEPFAAPDASDQVQVRSLGTTLV